MAISWVTGEIGSLEIVWTTFTIENVPVDSTKTVTDVDFEIAHDVVGHSVYYDEFELTSEVTSADDPPVEEGDITYVTIDDHSTVLPSSVQHENIIEANKHTPKAHDLNSHSDVVIASPVANHFLGWDTGTSKWINKLISTTDITWNEIVGATNAVVNNAYQANNVARVEVTLPVTAAMFDKIEVSGKGAGGWKILQNAGQTIHMGNLASTTGVVGYLESDHFLDSVELMCITADTDFKVFKPSGNITIN